MIYENILTMKKNFLIIIFCSLPFFFGSFIKKDPPKNTFVLSIEKTDATEGQADGSIMVLVSGGTAPYQLLIVSVPFADTKIFSRTNKIEATQLKAGHYQIHISDDVNTIYTKEIILE